MMNLKILSEDDRPFASRKEAGKQLAEALSGFREENPLVLGILRGGIVVAREIARGLSAQLDIVLTRKIGSPFDPEVAVGAVTEEGELIRDRRMALLTSADEDYIRREKARQTEEIEKRAKLFRAVVRKAPRKGRTVILADDGVATGATARASLWSLGAEKPARLVFAAPVGERTALKELSTDADEVFCIKAPHAFAAVSAYYENFPQVEDDEAAGILREYCEEFCPG